MKKIFLITISLMLLLSAFVSSLSASEEYNSSPTVELFNVNTEHGANEGWDLDNNDVSIDFKVSDEDEDNLDLYLLYGFDRKPPSPNAERYFGKIEDVHPDGYYQIDFDLDWIYTSHWKDYKGKIYVNIVAYDGDSYSNTKYNYLPYGIDGTNPSSKIDEIDKYNVQRNPLPVFISAEDETSNVEQVSLHYSYSPDNYTWTRIREYRTDENSPWVFNFDYPYGKGWYRLYSSSQDHAGNKEPTTGVVEEIKYNNTENKNPVYYFTNYKHDVAWFRNPQNMIDGDPYSFAVTAISGEKQLLTENNVREKEGKIVSVAISIGGYYHPDGNENDILIKPVFENGEGKIHELDVPDSPVCMVPVDITDDPNSPDDWTWDDVQNLDIKVIADDDALSGTFALFCSKVTIHVETISLQKLH